MSDRKQRNAETIVSLAKQFMSAMQRIEPKWERAYWRFNSEADNFGCKASYVAAEGIQIIDVIKERPFIQAMQSLGRLLWTEWENPNKRFCVCLLRIENTFDYDIQFEYEDSSKWQISKLNGGTGLPEGL